MSATKSRPVQADLDDTDRAILAALQEDASISNVELAGMVNLSPPACLRRVERLKDAWRIYPHDKSRAPELAQAVVDLVAREGWKVDGMYSERGELDEVFRRITLPDTVKQ